MDMSDSETENYVVIQDPSNPSDGTELKGLLPKKKRGRILQGNKPLVSAPDSSDSEGENDKVQHFEIQEYPAPVYSNENIVDNSESRKSKKVMSHCLWSKEEDLLLDELVTKMERWTDIAKLIPDRTPRQCRLRFSRIAQTKNAKFKNGPWSEEEDNLLKELVAKYGHKWAEIQTEMQNRTAEQIRGRYTISLTPDRVNGAWSREEHRILLDSQATMGNKWVEISKLLQGRVSKQIGSHFFEAVVPRMNLYLESLGKMSYSELTEEEIQQLITYLQVKRSSSVVSIHKKMNREPRRNSAYDETRPGHTKKSRRTKAEMLAANAAAGISETEGPQKKRRVETDPEGNISAIDSIEALDVSAAQHRLDDDSSDDEGAPRPMDEQSRKIRQLEKERDRQEEEDDRTGRKKIVWNDEEDAILKDLAGRRKAWTVVSKAMNGSKTPRQCRVRYTVVLNPDIKQGMWTEEEDQLLLTLMETYGHQWTDISLLMKNRTAEQVRGRFNNNSRAKQAVRDAQKRPLLTPSSSSSSGAQQQTHQYQSQQHLQQQHHHQQQQASLQVQPEENIVIVGDTTGVEMV